MVAFSVSRCQFCACMIDNQISEFFPYFCKRLLATRIQIIYVKVLCSMNSFTWWATMNIESKIKCKRVLSPLFLLMGHIIFSCVHSNFACLFSPN